MQDAKIFDDGLAALNRGDYATALRCFRPIADRGYTGAQFNLGIMYRNGDGVSQDFTEAGKWFRKAAEQGEAAAQYLLGLMYGNGLGVPQNQTEAMDWLQKAGEQGYAEAQYQLGVEFLDVLDFEAVKWFRKAAEQGHTGAQNNLGFFYANGKDIPQDFIQAHMWWNLAAACETDKERREAAIVGRDAAAKKMTTEQIAEAQKLAREWKPTWK